MPMMPRRQRALLLLRGSLKLMALVVVAGAVGTGLGLGMAAMTGDDDPPGAVVDPPPTADRSSPTVARSAPTPRVAPRVLTTSTRAQTPPDPLKQVRVSVISAVLHPAGTPAGQRRRRARLGVRVKVENRGTERVALERPSLLAARQRVPTNPAADNQGARLGPIDAGETVDVTLRFETAGAVTGQLTTQQRARIHIAGRSWPISVNIGAPASPSEPSGATAP